MIVDLKRCPRCGQSHEQMVFRPFKNKHGNEGWSHWSLCPDHREPVLIQVGGGSRLPPGALGIQQSDHLSILDGILSQQGRDPAALVFEARETIKGIKT